MVPIPKHTVLVLPFTTQILHNPEPILPLVYRVTRESSESCTILFSTPKVGDLYQTLRASPKKYWHIFQKFLGRVYATLSAAQWSVGKVLMDVEVGFEGCDIQLRFGGKEVKVVHLDGYLDLPVVSKLNQVLGEYTAQTIPTPASLEPSSGSINNLDSIINANSKPNSKSKSIADSKSLNEDTPPAGNTSYPTTALGGTFDHLHAAHKLLLHLSLFLTTKRLIVGLMTPSLLVSKSNYDLLESLDDRIRNTRDFLIRQEKEREQVIEDGVEGVELKLKLKLKLDIIEIKDPFGPTAWDDNIQALVVSRETISGGQAVNDKRKQNGLGELDVWVIDVIAAESVMPGIGGDDDDVEGGSIQKGSGNSIKTRDLSDVDDEGELKAMKMGSTAIRQWIKDHPLR